MNNNLSDLTFEEALIELENTVEQLESGGLSLEESAEKFERGQELTAICSNLVEQAAEQLAANDEDTDISPG